MSVPFCLPGLRLARHREALERAMAAVLDSGRYVLGPQVEAFEAEFGASLGGLACAGVGNGTDAVTLALLAAGVGQGAEVVCPALTAHGSVVGILRAGARPVFADVNRRTRCLDPEAARAAVGPATAAILAVHLHGVPAPMDELRAIADRHGLLLVEDAAQAQGGFFGDRPLGALGDVAAFSFYPTKNLGCMGDGGAVAARDAVLVERVRRLRCYGWDAERISREPGMNSRLDEVQAALLRVLLPHLPEEAARRTGLARRYFQALAGGPLGLPPDVPGAAWHQFAVAVEGRDGLRRWLAEGGVATDVHYPLGMHRMPAFPAGHAPVADELARTLVSLPIQPEIAEAHFPTIRDRLLAWGGAA